MSSGVGASFIDVESGGGPVHAPSPIGGPLNPGGPTPRPRLYSIGSLLVLIYYLFYYILSI